MISTGLTDCQASSFTDSGRNERNCSVVQTASKNGCSLYSAVTLRVLKKGGTFALHDIFSEAKYGDMQAFLRKLRDLGYEKVELIDTTDGMFMTKGEAAWMGLAGSALLTGRK